MAYVIGENCHITISHADIDAGTAYGFCVLRDGVKAEGIRTNREVLTDGTAFMWIYFDVISADRLINPDGSMHTTTKAQMNAKLQQFLAKTSGIVLTTPAGSYVSLCALGFTSDERHHPGYSIFKCQFNNIGYYWPPVDPEVLAGSVWDGLLTWETSYWR